MRVGDWGLGGEGGRGGGDGGEERGVGAGGRR